MQTGRLFEIVYLLMERKTMTAAQLSRELEVSTRTIRRDIEALSGAGVPVYMTRGKGGGIHLLDNYVLDKSLVSESEQDEILAALSALGRTGAVDGNDVRDRLARLFQREPSDWLDMDFSFWGAPPEYKRAFDVIRQAICTRHLLRFPYFDAVGNATIRTVEAGKLVFKESCWYVRAYCLTRQAWRTFKLFRIDWEKMELLPDRFSPRPVPEDLNESGAYPQGKTHLKLLISPLFKERVREEFAPEMIEYQSDGSLSVEVDCNLDDRTRHYLLSFGSSLEVIEPLSVRTWIVEQVQSIAAVYANNPSR